MRPVNVTAVRQMRGLLCLALASLIPETDPRRRIGEAAGSLARALAIGAKCARVGAPGLDRPAGVDGPLWGRDWETVRGGAPSLDDFAAADLDCAAGELREWITWAIESLDPIADGTARDPWDCLDGATFDTANALKVAAEYAPPATPGLDRPTRGVCWGRNPFAGAVIPAGEPVVYFVQASHADGSHGEPWPTARLAAVSAELRMRQEMAEELIVVERTPAGVRRTL